MPDNPEVIYAFIDSQNLNLSVQKDVFDKKTGKLIYKGWKLDFNRFHVYLRDKYKVSIAYLFIGYVKENQGLYNYLKKSGYKLIYKPTKKYSDGNDEKIKGNVDAELVLQSMIEFPNYDKAIIVAGDGDYRCLIEYLVSQRKLLKVLIPNKYSFSSLLRQYKPYMAYISDLQSKLQHK